MFSYLWGDKNCFAIEICKKNESDKYGRARLYLNSEEFGEFKKQYSYKYFIESLRKIYLTDELYDSKFNGLSSEEIFKRVFILHKGIMEFDSSDMVSMELNKKFFFNFGEQFDGVSFFIFINSASVEFFWSFNKKYISDRMLYLKNFKHCRIPKSYFDEVCEAFFLEFGEKQ